MQKRGNGLRTTRHGAGTTCLIGPGAPEREETDGTASVVRVAFIRVAFEGAREPAEPVANIAEEHGEL